jgi:hypothetical protein
MNKVELSTLPFEQRVWETLSRIDVTDHCDQLPQTKKRPAVSYLAWHKAWMLVKRKFPASTYTHKPDLHHQDGTVEVEVDVYIAEKIGTPESMYTNARLAVMDNWFNAIQNPNARDINDSRQRALVKALAFAGLGLNLWGEDIIPVGKLDDPINERQHKALADLIESTETNEKKFLEWCEVDDLADLPFERFTSAHNLLQAKQRRMDQAKQAQEEAADES